VGALDDAVLDMIDVAFQMIDTEIRSNEDAWKDDVQVPPDQAIAELNQRFREHGVGYEFVISSGPRPRSGRSSRQPLRAAWRDLKRGYT
jgi:hypothetical protein